MWIAKLKIKHDCTIGNRCKRFKCFSYSIPLGSWRHNSLEYTSERHTIEGDEENVKEFITDLKKDNRVKNLEVSKNTVFFVGTRKKGKIPSAYWNQKIFFVKPVFVDKEGFEYWEIASCKKEEITAFIDGVKKEKGLTLEIQKIQKAPFADIHFPRTMPNLTQKQKRAFELAIENGYYKFPRKSDLGKLAKIMGVSVSTCQEHLRKAEEKILPTFG